MQTAVELTTATYVEPHVSRSTAAAHHRCDASTHGEGIGVATVAEIADVSNQACGNHMRCPAQLHQLMREASGERGAALSGMTTEGK